MTMIPLWLFRLWDYAVFLICLNFNYYPYGTGFLIRTHELYGFDLPGFDVFVKRLKMGMPSMYEVIIMQIGELF